jgi:ABC-type uncharacterized transport system permease subunit
MRYSQPEIEQFTHEALTDGLCILRGHFPVEKLRPWNEEFQLLLKAHIEREGRLENRGSNRYYVTLPFIKPFADEEIFCDADVLAIVENLVGKDFVMCQLATDTPLGWLVLNHTRFGRNVFAVGDNDEAARLMGLNINRVTIAVYAISGALAGLAGVILASRLGAGQPVAGTGYELDAIAAVVIGGTLLTGGQGSVVSTLVGVLLLGVIFNLFNLEGTISPWWQLVLRGVILLFVVVAQNRLTKLK